MIFDSSLNIYITVYKFALELIWTIVGLSLPPEEVLSHLVIPKVINLRIIILSVCR